MLLEENWKHGLVAVLALSVAACGGGNGGSTVTVASPAPAAVSTAPAAATNAGASAAPVAIASQAHGGIPAPGAPPAPSSSPAPPAAPNTDLLRVAFIGGSITEGAFSTTPARSYAGLLSTWLGTRYGRVDVRNIGLGGTGSDFGVYRLEHDLEGFTPDVAFLEFTVNDADKKPAGMSGYLDGIIHKLRQKNPRVRVLYLSTTDVQEEPDRRAGRRAVYVETAATSAAAVGIPFIDATTLLWDKVRSGTPVSTYFSDNVHPNDAGHQIYFEAIRDALADGVPFAAMPATAGGRFIEQSRLDTARLVKGSAASGCRAGTWPLKYMDAAVTCDRGEAFTYRFTGTTVGVVRAMVRDGGRMDCTLDGANPTQVDFFDETVFVYERAFPLFLYRHLPSGEHTLSCRVNDEVIRTPRGASTGHKATVGAFMVSEERPITLP